MCIKIVILLSTYNQVSRESEFDVIAKCVKLGYCSNGSSLGLDGVSSGSNRALVFVGINSDDITKLVGAMTNGKLDEEKLMSAYFAEKEKENGAVTDDD